MEWLLAKLGSNAIGYASGGAVGVAVAFALKKIPNSTLKAKFGQMMYGYGIACTLGRAKWKFNKSIWNKTVGTWVIDAIDNIGSYGITEFVRGLRSDNK